MIIKSGLLAPISWKTVNSNDWNQVFNQRFSLKQCFAAGTHSCRLRKTWFCPLLFPNPIDLLSLYILFSHFKPHDALMGISLLIFSIVMRTFARAQDEIWKKLFPRVKSHGLKWENKTYKLKRSIYLSFRTLKCHRNLLSVIFKCKLRSMVIPPLISIFF